MEQGGESANGVAPKTALEARGRGTRELIADLASTEDALRAMQDMPLRRTLVAQQALIVQELRRRRLTPR